MSLLASFSILLSTSSRKIKDSSGKAAKHCLSAAVVMILTTEYFVARTVALGERHRPKTLNSPKRTASAMLVTSMLMCLIPSWSWKCSGIHWIFPPMDPAYRKRVGGMYYILLLCSWNTLDYDLKSSIIINYMHLYASICINFDRQQTPAEMPLLLQLHHIYSYRGQVQLPDSIILQNVQQILHNAFQMFKSERVESKNFQHIWTHNWHIWIIMIA